MLFYWVWLFFIEYNFLKLVLNATTIVIGRKMRNEETCYREKTLDNLGWAAESFKRRFFSVRIIIYCIIGYFTCVFLDTPVLWQDPTFPYLVF